MVKKTRQKILKFLKENPKYVSGEFLSKKLGISRVSVWKHIRNLQQDGYIIDASQKGYRLISSPDLLLPYEFPGWEEKIFHFNELDSTMNIARKMAKEGAKEWTIIIAETQTQGKGRLGRKWLSSKGGIYFTVILRPKITPLYAPRINLMASIAVARTIRKLFNLKAELKWPNDVLLNGKKICGILAEMDAEIDKINYVNLGIGINVNNIISKQEETAISLKEILGKEVDRKSFFYSLLKELKETQALLNKADLLEEWKRLSATLNKIVKVITINGEIIGKAIDIDAYGALLIKTSEGSLKSIFAGDCIHLR